MVVLFFSQTFSLGDDLIHFLLSSVTDHRWWRPLAMYGAAMIGMLLLYLCDFSYWSSPIGATMRRLCVLVCLALGIIAGMLTIDDFPVLPLAIAMLMLPFAALFLRVTLFRNNSGPEVSCVLGMNFVTSGMVILIVWLCWLFGAWSTSDNHWFENRHIFIDHAQCTNEEWETSYLQSNGVCLAAFLLWVSPLMLFGLLLFLGLFMMLLARTVARRGPEYVRRHMSAGQCQLRNLACMCSLQVTRMVVHCEALDAALDAALGMARARGTSI